MNQEGSKIFSQEPSTGPEPRTEGSEVSRAGDEYRVPLFPVLICSLISALMMHFGFFSFLFLAPLGFVAAAYSAAAAWSAFTMAAVINGIFFVVLRIHYGVGFSSLWIDLLYFTSISLFFTWIMAGGGGARLSGIRTAYRFIIAALMGTFVFVFVILGGRNSSGFAAMIRSQADLLSSVIISSAGADAVKRSLLEQTLTTEKVLEVLGGIVLRGGAVVSMFFLFFVNRRIAFTLVSIFKKRRMPHDLPDFHVPFNTIWFLSFSIAVVLLSRITKLEIPEIIAWNILFVCAILFLAQGAGIVLYILARLTVPPLMRIIINIMIFVIIFSPGLNTIALVALVVLGIAENWLPFRAPKKNGSAPTPGL